jgi:hypothetical protein
MGGTACVGGPRDEGREEIGRPDKGQSEYQMLRFSIEKSSPPAGSLISC